MKPVREYSRLPNKWDWDQSNFIQEDQEMGQYPYHVFMEAVSYTMAGCA